MRPKRPSQAGKGGVSPRAETTHSHIVVLKHGGDLAFCNAQYFKDMVEEGVDVCKGSARRTKPVLVYASVRS